MSKLNREQCISKGAFRRHVMRQIGGERNRRDELFLALKTRTEQIYLGDSFRSHGDERDLLDDLARLAVSAHPETPAESVSKPDLRAVRVQNLEVRGV